MFFSQVNDPWCNAFINMVNQLYAHWRRVIAPPSLAVMLNNLIDRVCNRLEETVKQKEFNILGAAMLHQDILRLSSAFQGLSETSVRHKFGRLNDVASLLNLQTLNDFHADFAGKAWKLSYPTEVRKILSLRKDFDLGSIQQIGL